MHTKPPPSASSARAISLRVLIAFLVLFGAGLYEVVGLPHAPNPPLQLPDSASLEALLRSSHPPLDGAIYFVGMLGWAIWAWLVLSLVLQVGATIGQRVAAGTAVVQRASSLADLLSAPIIRNTVRTSLAGGMMARVALGGVPVGAAAQMERPAVVVSISSRTSSGPDHRSYFRASSDDAAPDIPAGAIVYTVQTGDNLVRIAERFYDDGDKWQLLYETNQGRQMADGRTFDRAGVIQPGWQLVVPEPTHAIETDADGQRWYTVRQGDSLAGISARLLGDETRWPELYAANTGVRLDETHVLQDPRLIWPGLRLRLLAEDAQVASPHTGVAAATAKPAAEGSDVQDTGPVATRAAQPTPGALVPSTATATVFRSTPEAPLPTVAPVVLPTAESIRLSGSAAARDEAPGVSRLAGAAAGGGLAIVGTAGTALVLRRRRRRPRRDQNESDATVRAGFAEADTEDSSSDDSRDELNIAATIACRLSRALATEIVHRNGLAKDELPIDGARLVGVRHGRSSTTLLLQMPIPSRTLVIGCLRNAAVRAFGRKADVEAVVSRDGDVLVRLTAVADQLDTTELQDAEQTEAWPAPSLLLRLGLLADRQVFAANWDALSHVLVAAPLSQSAEAVLGGLITSLVAGHSPSQLGFVVLGDPRCLPEELLGLPHRLEPLVDPQDEEHALQLLNRIRQEVEKRVASSATDAPELVVLIPELTQLSAAHQVALGPVMLYGPLHRVRVVAASTRRGVDLVQSSTLIPEFGTRLVLRVADDEESTVLLGSADATELGPGGHLLARLEGRVPIQAYGYRVDADRLARLAAAIRSQAIAGEWWDNGGVLLEQSTQPSDEAAEPNDAERELVRSEEEVHPDTTAADESDPAGSSDPLRLVDLDQRFDGHLETQALSTEGVDAQPPTSANTGLADSEATAKPADHIPEGLLAAGQAARNGESATAGVTSGQLWSSATAPRPRLRGRFLGARELVYDGQVVWPVPGQPEERTMELLVYLGVQDPSGVRAELLGDSLWSDDDDDDSRTERLRKLRYRMRQALKRMMPGFNADPIAAIDKKNPVYRLNPSVIESDVHRFLKLVQEAKSLPPESAGAAYEAALELYGGDLLERPDVPPYRWMDDGPRLVDLRVKYAAIAHQARRRLADLLAAGTEDGLARAEELYIGLAEDDPLDHRVWEALARLHERRNDLLGLEASMRRLRSALVELGEGDDPDHLMVPPALERVFTEVRAALLEGRAA